jgi:hypothetical protein
VRRLASLAASILVLSLAAAPPALASTRVVEPAPQRVDVALDGICAFPVSMTDRGGLTKVTTYDDAGAITRIEVRGTTVAVFTRVDNGAEISLESTSTAVFKQNDDGSWTDVQRGLGYAIDSGVVTGTPNLEWFTGTVVSTGTLDLKTLSLDVTSQERSGIAGDICEMLVTGLKTRH